MNLVVISATNAHELEQVEEYGYVVVGDSAQRAREIQWLLSRLDKHHANIDALTAERDELRRRLDAVLAIWREGFNRLGLCRCEDMEVAGEPCGHCSEYARAKAIAEGKL